MVFFKRFRLKQGDRHPALKPRRRLIRRLAIGIISLAGIVTLAWLLRIPLRDDLVQHVLTLAEKEGYYVGYEEIWGDIFSGINFSSIEIVADDDHWLTAEKLNLSYRLLPLLFENRFEIRSVRLIRPEIRWLLPEEKPEDSEPFDPDFSLDLTNFHIRSGRIELADTLILDAIQFNATLEIRPHLVTGRVRRAAATMVLNHRDRLNLRSAKTSFSYSPPDSITLRDLLVVTSGSHLEADLALNGARWNAVLKEIDLDLSELDPEGLSGRLNARGFLLSETSGYAGELEAELLDVKMGSFELAQSRLSVAGDDGLFDIIIDASHKELGSLGVSGMLSMDTSSLNARLSFLNVDLYPAPDWPISFTGELNIGYRFAEKEGIAFGKLRNISLSSMSWDLCSFDLSFAEDLVDLKNLSLTRSFSEIKAQCRIQSGAVNGKLDVQGFQLASLRYLNPL
ncbi:hypothetical protein GF359_09975, partial [candidate division WOR-3 bacterium]|nr:hypothetical protein [candidate division WOR-3 bacterium]MBD3365528.1 hypothetical protein [candidate division WOR-3 bacterium]